MPIPKVIHYCWFGGNPKGEKELRCIESWKKYCPDYEIIEWNEQNYDVNSHAFVRDAYQRKKWAFVSDYARLEIIYQHGGIYLDTDVEIIRPIDKLLSCDMFAGFEDEKAVNYGLGFGAEKHHPYLQETMQIYDEITFPEQDKELKHIACPKIQTDVLKRHGLVPNGKSQRLEKCHVFSTQYFSPKSFQTGEIHVTPNTYSIHHFNMSWFTPEQVALRKKEWALCEKYKYRFIARILIYPDKLKFQYHQGGIKGLTKYFQMVGSNLIGKIIKN